MRRKAPKVVWLPGTNASSVDVAGISAWNTVQLDFPPGSVLGDIVAAEVPVVIDGDQDPGATNITLADIEGQAYRLRRIVGKIWCFAFGGDGQGGIELVGAEAAYIVRTVKPSTGQSLALLTSDPFNIAPSPITADDNPWIWHRSWMMTVEGSKLTPEMNTDNWSLGPSALDGPHVDQKTARVVKSDERLFLDFSISNLSQIQTPTISGISVRFFWKHRILASMRTTSGNRGNSSR